MDECADKTHDCDMNADCNNTLGSYECSCKDGYHENGTNCSGNLFSHFLRCLLSKAEIIGLIQMVFFFLL